MWHFRPGTKRAAQDDLENQPLGGVGEPIAQARVKLLLRGQDQVCGQEELMLLVRVRLELTHLPQAAVILKAQRDGFVKLVAALHVRREYQSVLVGSLKRFGKCGIK